MRMIDGDRLLRELTALSHGQVWPGWTCEGIRLLIERQPTLTPPNEWVSVENALPEECADILLCRKILKIPEIGTYQQARFWVYDEIGDVYQVDDVTHWLPIPTPYDIDHIHISEPHEG